MWLKMYSSGILRVSRPPEATSGAVMVSCYSVYHEKDGLVSLFLHSDKCSKKLYNLLYNNSNINIAYCERLFRNPNGQI